MRSARLLPSAYLAGDQPLLGALTGETAEIREAAEVIASELLANALLHGRPPLTLRLRRVGDRIRTEVEDAGRSVPVLSEVGHDGKHGAGLAARPDPALNRRHRGAGDSQRSCVDVVDLAAPLGTGGAGHAVDNVLGALRAAVGPEMGDELALLAAEFRGQ